MSDFVDEIKKFKKPPDYDACSAIVQRLLATLNSRETGNIKIVGQEDMNRRLVSALILNENALLEGLPGVAKTTAVKNLAKETCLFFNRVQFVPDMQPSDLIGRMVIEPTDTGSFSIVPKDGPLFANLVLADEINRAPSKVQAALLEAMGEKQITPFGEQEKVIRHPMEKEILKEHKGHPACAIFKDDGIVDVADKRDTQFSVFATMNPIEIEGTYPLSEAQLDRFFYKTLVNYPNLDDLLEIGNLVFQRENEVGKNGNGKSTQNKKRQSAVSQTRDSHPDPDDFIWAVYFLRHCRKVIFSTTLDSSPPKPTHISEDIIARIGQIVYFSNYKYDDKYVTPLNDGEQLQLRMKMRDKKHEKAQSILGQSEFKFIQSGSSPRGLESLLKSSLCEAFLDGKDRVDFGHVQKAAADVLRHRIRLTIQAKTKNVTSIDIVDTLLERFLTK